MGFFFCEWKAPVDSLCPLPAIVGLTEFLVKKSFVWVARQELEPNKGGLGVPG